VAQEADRDTTKPKVVNAVTVEVTPEQAEMLDLARSVGTLSLVLRNQSEQKTAGTTGITKAELLGLASPTPASAPAPVPAPVRRVSMPVVAAAPAPAPRPANCIDVIRGTSKVVECF
jgi:pilus assembly protein CpaB